MSSILILYDTTEGQTRRIARYVADAVAGDGRLVDVHEIRKLPRGFAVDRFDAVIVGASIHMGRHSKRLSKFLAMYRPGLERIPSAFFSVSLSAAGTEEETRRAEGYVTELLEQTGWRPPVTATFAGGLRYREYGFLKRWIMKKIARDAGKDTDTSKNHEYTDWDAVDRFVRDFLSLPEGKPA